MLLSLDSTIRNNLVIFYTTCYTLTNCFRLHIITFLFDHPVTKILGIMAVYSVCNH